MGGWAGPGILAFTQVPDSPRAIPCPPVLPAVHVPTCVPEGGQEAMLSRGGGSWTGGAAPSRDLSGPGGQPLPLPSS